MYFSKIAKLKFLLTATFFCLFLSVACNISSSGEKANSLAPNVYLWAWERPENLEFIDTKKFGVAYLAQTLRLEQGKVVFVPRRQPLKVAPDTELIAVTRIETPRSENLPENYTDANRAELIRYILKSIENKKVSGIQIDFDAKVSEREFYRKLLTDLRQSLPQDTRLSITALASFCVSDNWIENLPVDEVVPMIFRMGADDKKIKEYLANGGDFQIPSCRKSYGIATDEPVKTNFASGRKIFVFNTKSWTPNDVQALKLN